jgi:ketosteroid isomerase-like protein
MVKKQWANTIKSIAVGSPAVSAVAGLRELVDAYAVAVDSRDVPLCASLWAEEAILVSHGATAPGSLAEFKMPDETERFMNRLQRWDRTLHHVSTHHVVSEGSDVAVGKAYCEAHHILGESDLVMAVQYDDAYSRSDGGWRFARRDVWILWTSENLISPRTVAHADHPPDLAPE